MKEWTIGVVCCMLFVIFAVIVSKIIDWCTNSKPCPKLNGALVICKDWNCPYCKNGECTFKESEEKNEQM